jgi:hypothetical protein
MISRHGSLSLGEDSDFEEARVGGELGGEGDGAWLRSNKMEHLSGSGRKCWSAAAGNQEQFPANRGFRAQAGCQWR